MYSMPLFSSLILIFCTLSIAGAEAKILPEKQTPRNAHAKMENGILSVQAQSGTGGVSIPVRCPAGSRVNIEFEASGNGRIQYSIQSPLGQGYSPQIPLQESTWRKISFSAFSPKTALTLYVYALKAETNFRLRNFRIKEAPSPVRKDITISQLDFEAEDYPGKNGKIEKVEGASGGKAVWGKRWYQAAEIPLPATTHDLYLFLRVKKDSATPLTVELRNGMQPVGKSRPFKAQNSWEWLRIGPVDPRAALPEVTVIYTCDAQTQIYLDRIAVSTLPELPEKDKVIRTVPRNGLTSAAKASPAPEIDGKLDDACWKNAVTAFPFILNTQNRFAKEQTSVRFAWDKDNLYAAFHCLESCLSPVENRLHEFKRAVKNNDNPAIYQDDCVLFLLKPHREAKTAYDFVINPNGAILDAKCASPDFWGSRDLKWSSGAKAAAYVGDGFWNVEIAIPFASLGGTPAENAEWEIMAGRLEQSRNEKSAWQVCEQGFHNAPLGTLVFREQVPVFALAGIPVFLPGNNKLAFTLPVKSEVMTAFSSTRPERTFSDGKEAEFRLNRSGEFSFRWSAFDDAMNRIFASPVYAMRAQAAILTHNIQKAQLRLNGEVVAKEAPLSSGMNLLEITGTPEKTARIMVGKHEIPLAGFGKENGMLRLHLLLEDSVIWPNWEAREVGINRGGIQQILFRPQGVKDFTLDDYTMYFDLPEGFTVEGASGYYRKWQLSVSEKGKVMHNGKPFRRYAVKIEGKVPYNTKLGSHEWIAFVLRAPENPDGKTGEFYFHAGSPKAFIAELPRRVAVRFYPKLNGAALGKLHLQMWGGWITSMDSAELRGKIASQLGEMGINEMNFTSDSRIPRFRLINFATWNLSTVPFLKQHPETAKVDASGRKVNTMVCSGVIRKDPRFAAFLRETFPKWHQRQSNGVRDIMWDYEGPVLNSELSCFCPRCLEEFGQSAGIAGKVERREIETKYMEQWTVYMNRKMADISGILRDQVHALPGNLTFTVYSGYESAATHRIYGVNFHDRGDRPSLQSGRPLVPELFLRSRTPALRRQRQ